MSCILCRMMYPVRFLKQLISYWTICTSISAAKERTYDRKRADRGPVEETFNLAEEISQLKPWKSLPEYSVFGVRLPEDNVNGYIAVIGELGRVSGVMAYIGEPSFRIRGQRERISFSISQSIRPNELIWDIPAEINQKPR